MFTNGARLREIRVAYKRLEQVQKDTSNNAKAERMDAHVSQMACSQHGSLKALTASLLQLAHRSLCGISSGANELPPVSILHDSEDGIEKDHT